MKTVNKYFSTYYILLLLILLPLYVENAYFNTIEAKFKALSYITIINIIPLFILIVINSFSWKKYEKIEFNIIDCSITCFACIALLSSLISEKPTASFFGYEGWYVGSFTVLVLLISYFYLSRNYIYSHNIWIPVYAINIFIFAIGILQFAGIDLFGFTENIVEKQYYQYISTLGNTNWCAGYLCIFLPMAFVFFLLAKNRISYYINIVFLIFGNFVLLLIISDGAYIGLGICAFFSIPYICKSIENIKRTSVVGIVFSLGSFLINLLPCFDGLMKKIEGISALMLDIRIAVFTLFVCIAGFILCSKAKGECELPRKILCIVAEAILTIAVVIAVVYTAINFSDRWGSSRGLIWRVSFENFNGFGVLEKLIGIGPELLGPRYTEVQRVFENLAVLSSHSEPIQILLTTGIFGLTSYLSVLFGTFRSYIKKGRFLSDTRMTAFFLAIVGYWGQSLVNSATTVNLCVLCVVYSFFRQCLCKTEKV